MTAPRGGEGAVDAETAIFFHRMPQSLPLYEAFRSAVCRAYPDVAVKVQKTQISFSNRYGFAFVSLPRKKTPDACVVISFGLPARLDSPRVLQAVEPYPDRWTHHVPVRGAEEIDAELLGWICAAYAFSATK